MSTEKSTKGSTPDYWVDVTVTVHTRGGGTLQETVSTEANLYNPLWYAIGDAADAARDLVTNRARRTGSAR
jgi:hypothetical protein